MNKIVILCIEGERNATESTFFNKIANSSKQLFENLEIKFRSFDYSNSDKNKEKIINFLDFVVCSVDDESNFTFFVVHDDDCKKNKNSLDATFNFIEEKISEKNKTHKVFRIFEKNKSFDYFLYFLLEDDLNPNSKDIKKFMTNNNLKEKPEKNKMWDLLYEKAKSKRKGKEKLKETLIFIKKKRTKELKTFEIIDKILENKFF